MRSVSLYLQDIREAMDSIELFVSGMTFQQFLADKKTTSAVLQKLQVIGEAAKAIPSEIRAEHPEVPWKEMGGMRDRLIHAYFGVDFGLVWAAITERFPVLRPAVERMLRNVS